MKKIIALILALLVATTLVACAGDADEGNALESIQLDDNTYSNNNLGSFTYEVSADGHYEITGYTVNVATAHDLVIPESIDDIAITAIADEAFKSCTSITSVTIPDSVKSIGEFAFYDCDKLAKVTIADSVAEIGTGAFRGCDVLAEVKLPASLTEVADELFWECPSLTSVSFAGNVEVIGNGAFYNCDALASIVIPSTVKEVKPAAFYGCDALVSITVPESVTVVGDAAFSGIAAEKVTFNAKSESFFATYFEATYGINVKDYSHYELVLN